MGNEKLLNVLKVRLSDSDVGKNFGPRLEELQVEVGPGKMEKNPSSKSLKSYRTNNCKIMPENPRCQA